MSTAKLELHKSIAKLLDVRLNKFLDESSQHRALNALTCQQIFEVTFNSLVEVMTAAKVNLSNEAMNYIAQQYYDGMLINGTQELDPNIFTQRAKLENIETRELALMALTLNGTDFTIPIIQEVKRRS
jgi:gamma-glutamyl-gamma-aminobutyrate hydrolase PuuD